MKNVIRTLLLTSAIVCMTSAAQAEVTKVTSETSIQKTNRVYSDASVENRIILDMEQALSSHGYNVGRIDSTFDAKTDQAVRAYQRDNGMVVDGVATPAILASLGVDTTIHNTHRIQQTDTVRYDLANKGSENANVYDDADADRTVNGGFRQRYQRMSVRNTTYAPMGTTVTTRDDVRYAPVMMNR